MRDAVGTNSWSRPSLFAPTSATRKLISVALPPGRARLVTRPSLTGSSLTPNTFGIVVVAFLAATEAGVLLGIAMTLTFRWTQDIRLRRSYPRSSRLHQDLPGKDVRTVYSNRLTRCRVA